MIGNSQWDALPLMQKKSRTAAAFITSLHQHLYSENNYGTERTARMYRLNNEECVHKEGDFENTLPIKYVPRSVLCQLDWLEVNFLTDEDLKKPRENLVKFPSVTLRAKQLSGHAGMKICDITENYFPMSSEVEPLHVGARPLTPAFFSVSAFSPKSRPQPLPLSLGNEQQLVVSRKRPYAMDHDSYGLDEIRSKLDEKWEERSRSLVGPSDSRTVSPYIPPSSASRRALDVSHTVASSARISRQDELGMSASGEVSHMEDGSEFYGIEVNRPPLDEGWKKRSVPLRRSANSPVVSQVVPPAMAPQIARDTTQGRPSRPRERLSSEEARRDGNPNFIQGEVPVRPQIAPMISYGDHGEMPWPRQDMHPIPPPEESRRMPPSSSPGISGTREGPEMRARSSSTQPLDVSQFQDTSRREGFVSAPFTQASTFSTPPPVESSRQQESSPAPFMRRVMSDGNSGRIRNRQSYPKYRWRPRRSGSSASMETSLSAQSSANADFVHDSRAQSVAASPDLVSHRSYSGSSNLQRCLMQILPSK